MKFKGILGIVAALALSMVAAGSVFAADYSSQITAMGGDLVADATPNVLAAVGVGLLLFGLFFGADLLFKAVRKARKGA
jgi:hypothetical protein